MLVVICHRAHTSKGSSVVTMCMSSCMATLGNQPEVVLIKDTQLASQTLSTWRDQSLQTAAVCTHCCACTALAMRDGPSGTAAALCAPFDRRRRWSGVIFQLRGGVCVSIPATVGSAAPMHLAHSVSLYANILVMHATLAYGLQQASPVCVRLYLLVSPSQ